MSPDHDGILIYWKISDLSVKTWSGADVINTTHNINSITTMQRTGHVVFLYCNLFLTSNVSVNTTFATLKRNYPVVAIEQIAMWSQKVYITNNGEIRFFENHSSGEHVEFHVTYIIP